MCMLSMTAEAATEGRAREVGDGQEGRARAREDLERELGLVGALAGVDERGEGEEVRRVAGRRHVAQRRHLAAAHAHVS